jgi:hypothetical protein
LFLAFGDQLGDGKFREKATSLSHTQPTMLKLYLAKMGSTKRTSEDKINNPKIIQ